jgi:GTP-binding protein HflX
LAKDNLERTERTDSTTVNRERVILAAMLPGEPGSAALRRDALSELRSLAETAGAVVVDELIQGRARITAGTYMGSGKSNELAELVKAHKADAVIFENDLSPSQIRNIEEVVKCKVLDRSELILDIFASRARTHEAKLQVELAQLEYTYPRLAGMWTHLERIGAGAGAGIGTRGPGEQQIEIDRRIVQRRKAELKREIETIQQRKRREVEKRNTDFYTVGIVGYTNAGKSTLFNTLTGAGVYADDKLFATLDTRTRKWELGGGDFVMLSDTVGFVRDLPHHLVASFRATLEESIHSELLMIVIDVADPEAEKHYATVQDVLGQIGAGDKPQLLVLNKVDKLEDNAPLLVWQKDHPGSLAISAAAGVGLDKVVEAVRDYQKGQLLEVTLRLSQIDGKSLNFLEQRSKVLDRQYEDSHVDMKVVIGKRQLDQLRATGAKMTQIDPPPPKSDDDDE